MPEPLELQLRNARHRKAKKDRSQAPRDPKQIRVRLARSYVRKLRKVQEAVRPSVERAAKEVGAREDSVDNPVIRESLDGIGVVMSDSFTEQNTRPQLLKTVKELGKFNSEELSRVINIDVRADLGIGEVMDSFVADNLRLINGMNEKTLGEIGAILDANHGKRAEDIKGEIMERFEVDESRAALIARDQVLKKNGALHKIRQQKAGIEEYEWVTSSDERVRPSHAELDGEIFSWAEGAPLLGGLNPGEDVQCRCTAMPIIPGVDE